MKDTTENKTCYVNDFHREWNKRCMEENERVRQNPLTVEQLRAQCKRLTELVEEAEKKERAERKAKKELSKKY